MKKVEIGSEVLVRFNDGVKEEYKIVHPQEADILGHKVSSHSPFGKAVLGQTKNKRITYINPSGQKLKFEILNVR